MTIIGRLSDGFLLVKETTLGPPSYATASKPTRTFPDLSQGIEQVVAVFASDGSVSLDTGVRPTPTELEFEVRRVASGAAGSPGSGGNTGPITAVTTSGAVVPPIGVGAGHLDEIFSVPGLGVTGAPGEVVAVHVPLGATPPGALGVVGAFPIAPDTVVVRFINPDGSGPALGAGLPCDFVNLLPSTFTTPATPGGGAAVEVADVTNLIGVTFTFVVIGR